MNMWAVHVWIIGWAKAADCGDRDIIMPPGTADNVTNSASGNVSGP